jgi:hypothetical protein
MPPVKNAVHPRSEEQGFWYVLVKPKKKLRMPNPNFSMTCMVFMLHHMGLLVKT